MDSLHWLLSQESQGGKTPACFMFVYTGHDEVCSEVHIHHTLQKYYALKLTKSNNLYGGMEAIGSTYLKAP